MKKNIFLFVFIFIFLIGLISAENYIIAEIEILDNGEVEIKGKSNFDLNIKGIDFSEQKIYGKTHALTKKDKDIWTFFINFEQEFSEISLKIYFPKNIKLIKNLNSNLDNRLDLKEQISIKITDHNKPINFSIDYVLENKRDYNFIFILVLGLIIIILSIFILNKKKINKLDFISDLLNEKEKKIIDLLMKKSMKQKEIRKKLDIPKASFSRYILNLEKKKIILREGEGKNKIIRLK